MPRLITQLGYPRVAVTDRLRSYDEAFTGELMVNCDFEDQFSAIEAPVIQSG